MTLVSWGSPGHVGGRDVGATLRVLEANGTEKPLVDLCQNRQIAYRQQFLPSAKVYYFSQPMVCVSDWKTRGSISLRGSLS